MSNYALRVNRNIIEMSFSYLLPLDICLVTYNRLVYLQKCFWSIIANTSVPYRLYIRDDGSTDGTKEWLREMVSRGLVAHFEDGDNIGSTNSLNKIISMSRSDLFIAVQDDMYFFRYWDFAVLDIFMQQNDAGLVSFYDFLRLGKDEGTKNISETVIKVPRTGMAATLINRRLFNVVKGFNLPAKNKMGFFASSFCHKASRVKMIRKSHYVTVPNYAIHMDNPSHNQNSLLNERAQLEEYEEMRKREKKGKSVSQYMRNFGDEK